MKELKKITWYSKLLTLFAMIAFMVVGFFIGMAFESEQASADISISA